MFSAYRDYDRKSKVFKRDLPDDKNLHELCRRVELWKRLAEFSEEKVKIDPEGIVNTESNVNSSVLRKILFKVGMDLDRFQKYYSSLDELCGKRNAIAHGDYRKALDNDNFKDYEEKAYSLFNTILNMVTRGIVFKEFVKW